jgi:pyruvate/2-oxoacid:ferredoxin oxidoreductase beta subunit
LGKEMRVGGGGGASKIPAISHCPAQTKREQFNNVKEEHYAIKKSRPEARQYDTIPETTRAGGQHAVDEIA